MSQYVLSWPDDLADAIRLSPEEVPFRVGLMAAIKMFELGELSSCKAAFIPRSLSLLRSSVRLVYEFVDGFGHPTPRPLGHDDSLMSDGCNLGSISKR